MVDVRPFRRNKSSAPSAEAWAMERGRGLESRMSDTEDPSRKDPTARLEAALDRIAAAVDRRRPAGEMTPSVTQEVAARLDVLIRQIRGVLQPVEG